MLETIFEDVLAEANRRNEDVLERAFALAEKPKSEDYITAPYVPLIRCACPGRCYHSPQIWTATATSFNGMVVFGSTSSDTIDVWDGEENPRPIRRFCDIHNRLDCPTCA